MKTYSGPVTGAAMHSVLTKLSREGIALSGLIYTGLHVRPTPDGGLFLEPEFLIVGTTEG